MGRVDRRVIRTRQLLHKALLDLIVEQGYESIRVQDITEKANLGRATFYVHYKDKEDLLLASLAAIREEMQERMVASGAKGAFPGFRVTFEHAAENPDIYKALRQVGGMRSIRNMMVQNATTILEQITTEPLIPLEAVAVYTMGAFSNMLDWWLESGMTYSIDEMEEMFMLLVQKGVPAALQIDEAFIPPEPPTVNKTKK